MEYFSRKNDEDNNKDAIYQFLKMEAKFNLSHFHKIFQFCLTHFCFQLRSCSSFNPSICEYPGYILPSYPLHSSVFR